MLKPYLRFISQLCLAQFQHFLSADVNDSFLDALNTVYCSLRIINYCELHHAVPSRKLLIGNSFISEHSNDSKYTAKCNTSIPGQKSTHGTLLVMEWPSRSIPEGCLKKLQESLPKRIQAVAQDFCTPLYKTPTNSMFLCIKAAILNFIFNYNIIIGFVVF